MPVRLLLLLLLLLLQLLLLLLLQLILLLLLRLSLVLLLRLLLLPPIVAMFESVFLLGSIPLAGGTARSLDFHIF
jgi:hypothetical protein